MKSALVIMRKMNKTNLIFIALLFFTAENTLANNVIEPVMQTIPAGSFKMGSAQRKNSQPIQKVNIREFSLGKYEVTVKEFRQFVEATNYKVPNNCRHEMDTWFLLATEGNWDRNVLTTNEFQPVVCINWKSANAYVEWLAEETGKPYRLPSEAEWEYAARAGTSTDYYFGNDEGNSEICKYENTGDLYGENILQRDSNTTYFNWTGNIANCSDNSAYSSIVGMYKPNPLGLHDMISNVREMLADCYVNNYEYYPNNGSAFIIENCKRRSARGSSWHWSHWPLVNRTSIRENFSGGVDGFRIAHDGRVQSLSPNTQTFLSDLKIVQQKEATKRSLHSLIPKPVSNLKIEQLDNVVTLTWDKSKNPEVKSYRVYRNAISGKMIKLIATNITRNSFIDGNAQAHEYDYTVVAVRQNIQSNYALPVTTTSSWIDISDKIEAEWATSHEGSRTSFSNDIDRGGFILTSNEGIDAGARLIYQLNIPLSGYYQLAYRVAASRDTEGFKVNLGNKTLSTNQVVSTGGLRKWETQTGQKIYLEKGKKELELESLDSHWKLNWFELTPISIKSKHDSKYVS